MNYLFARYRNAFRSILTLFFLVALVCAVSAQDTSKLTIKRGAESMMLVHHDLSIPLREIAPVANHSGVKRIRPIKRLPVRHDPNAPVTGNVDPGLQTFAGLMNMPATSLNFEGIGEGLTGYAVNVAPPDTNGDVGPNHYVQVVNSDLAVWNKSGSKIYGPANINTLFSGFGGGCQTNNDGDPTVTYDQNNDRWVITQFSVSTTPYLECVAVSQTGDPTGSYYRFSYSFGSTDFNDYPKTGMWNGDYYITYNIFANASFFSGAKVCAHQGSKLRTGAVNTMQCFSTSSSYGSLLAADQDSAANPPAGAPEHVLAYDTNILQVWKMKVDWTTPANSTFSGPTNLSVNSFSAACGGGACIPQAGTTNQLDSLADRLMNRVQYRNFGTHEAFAISHSVTAGSVASGVRWYELRTSNSATTTPSVYQQGTYSPDTTSRWMSSIAMDKSGNIAIGYSASSSTINPGIRYAGRLSTDPVGQMTQGESTMINGTGSQTGGLHRWGDYSNMSIDPSDDCTFWYTTEYLAASGSFNWSTRIGSFKFSTCGGGTGDTIAPTTSITAPSAGATLSGNATISASATDNVGVTNVEFYADSNFIGSDSTSPYSINWDTTTLGNGSYTLTSRANDAAGNVGTSAGVGVTVSNAGQAAYDATLKAPNCSAAGSYCDSGSLLVGRGTMSPGEPNQPNTINNSCSDGGSGTYHSDESLDRLKVATSDSSNFAAGKTVNITATVWCWGTSDSLDLYYTANANSPSWTLIGSQACSVSGQAVAMTASYALPSGSLQAIRGNFRYTGSQSSCSTGAYDDHDDLIFAVGGSTGDTTAPSTSITAPTAGSTVSGTITVSANASDNVGVTKVEFYAGVSLIGTDTTSPYSITWNTTAVANGSYTLTSKAYDAANNVGTSTGVGITVNNSVTCGSSSQLLANSGFESGATGWTASSTSIITNSTSRPAHSGSYYAWLNGLGTSNTQNLDQQVNVPSNACSAQLSFWLRIDTAETSTTVTDRLKIQIRQQNADGTWSKWSTKATYSNLNASSTYAQKIFDLATYKGKTIQVRFFGKENGSKQTSFLIDDTAIDVTQ